MAVTPFATATDLATRLGRDVWPAGLELAQVEALLLDATAHLQTVIGAQVSPPATVTVSHVLERTDEWIQVPFQPATVESVAVAGRAITDFTVIDATVYLPRGWASYQQDTFTWPSNRPVRVDITYSVGFAAVPAELVAWACVLASQALTVVTDLGALGPGGVSSIGIDDYRKAWDPNATPGGGIPERVAERLRATYGRSAYVTQER